MNNYNNREGGNMIFIAKCISQMLYSIKLLSSKKSGLLCLLVALNQSVSCISSEHAFVNPLQSMYAIIIIIKGIVQLHNLICLKKCVFGSYFARNI